MTDDVKELDVVIANTFGSNSGKVVNFEPLKFGDTENDKKVPPKNGTKVQKSGQIKLKKKEILEINVKYTQLNQNENFTITIMPTKVGTDYPKIRFQRDYSTWTLINIGDNTHAEIGAGPDGQ